MKKLEFNKLVGDNVVPRLEKQGLQFEARTIESDEEFAHELARKIVEEAGEVRDAGDRSELVKEIADLLDVIAALRELRGITDEELTTAIASRREKRGGFTKRSYVLWTEDDGYRSNGSKG